MLGCYDFPRKYAYVFCQEVGDNFENQHKVLEGQYGRWFSQEAAMAEQMLIDEDKAILKDFFNKV